MNKYKNKTLIPIKVTIYFFPVKSRVIFYRLSILSVFYIYTIIYSLKISLNLNEFLSSAEHKCYFEECGRPNSCESTVTSMVFFSFNQSQCGPAAV